MNATVAPRNLAQRRYGLVCVALSVLRKLSEASEERRSSSIREVGCSVRLPATEKSASHRSPQPHPP